MGQAKFCSSDGRATNKTNFIYSLDIENARIAPEVVVVQGPQGWHRLQHFWQRGRESFTVIAKASMTAPVSILRTKIYRSYDLYLQRGQAGLQDRSLKLEHDWSRVPDEVRRKVGKLSQKEPERSPRELAVTFTEKES